MKERLLLIGGGGHCRSCLDVIRTTGKYNIVGILDVESKIGTKVLGVDIIGSDADIEQYLIQTDLVLITIGHIGENSIRQKLYQNTLQLNAKFATIISPRAYVSSSAKIAPGTIIMHDALVNSCVKIGENSIINTKALIEHDAVVGNHTHISTAVVLNGACSVGDNCFVGSSSVIFESRHVQSNTVVPGGSIIRKNYFSQINDTKNHAK